MRTLPPLNSIQEERQWLEFSEALKLRRERVYDFLDSWPGAAAFRPIDIHDGIFSYINRRGKALRPLLVLLSCGAVGGDEDQSLPAAAAVEVFHTWTLVHDDIIDRDDTRRGHPTVHSHYATHANQVHGMGADESRHYGTAVAILTGDLQQSWSYALLSSLVDRGVSHDLVIQLIARMAGDLTPRLMEGEMLDVQYSLTAPEELSEEDILEMLGKKTGALLQYGAWAGALIGLAGGHPGPADKLGRFAYLCGTAFQLHDDLLGLMADESVLGKPVGSDIREGKRTLLVHYALSHSDTVDRQHLLHTLGNSNCTSVDLKRSIQIIEGSKAPEYISQLANHRINEALLELQSLPDTIYTQLLRSWALFMLARQN